MEVVHEPALHRFAAGVDGRQGELEYRLAGNTMTIVHTAVPVEFRGRGIAAELVRYALETARTRGWKVVPACSYAAAYLRKHRDEYADLLA